MKHLLDGKHAARANFRLGVNELEILSLAEKCYVYLNGKLVTFFISKFIPKIFRVTICVILNITFVTCVAGYNLFFKNLL